MAYDAGYRYIFISDRPRLLTESCYTRTAVKKDWSIKRFESALNQKIPLSEVIIIRIKALAKFIFRESGYNMIRNILIKMFK